MKQKLISSHLSVVAVIICMIVIAGCGPLPQPFRGTPSIASNNPLVDVPTAVGIAVLPIKGAPEPFNENLSAAVAEQLRLMEIPAEAVPYNAGLGFSLEGWAEAIAHSSSGISADIIWTLRSRAGATTGTYRQHITLSESAWTEGDPLTAARLSAEASSAVITMVGGDAAPVRAPPARAAPTPDYPTISVRPVEGAPGDGREALMLAVLQSLSLNGVARDDINPDVILTCEIISTPYDARLQHVQIIWHAMLPDGSELGTVQLDNTIPVGALDGIWGPTAFAIADAGAPDLLNLLASAPDLEKSVNP